MSALSFISCDIKGLQMQENMVKDVIFYKSFRDKKVFFQFLVLSVENISLFQCYYFYSLLKKLKKVKKNSIVKPIFNISIISADIIHYADNQYSIKNQDLK